MQTFIYADPLLAQIGPDGDLRRFQRVDAHYRAAKFYARLGNLDLRPVQTMIGRVEQGTVRTPCPDIRSLACNCPEIHALAYRHNFPGIPTVNGSLD